MQLNRLDYVFMKFQIFRDYNMCMTAVKSNGDALEFVSHSDHDIYLVSNYGDALYHVPEEMRDLDICLAAVKKYDKCIKICTST